MFGSKERKRREEMDRLSELKGFKFQSVLTAILFVLMGAVLAVNPVGTTRTICFTIGYIIIAISIVYIIGYFISDFKNNLQKNKLVIGIILLIIGLFFILGYRIIMSIIPTVLGVMIFLSGLTKLQTAFNARKINNEGTGWIMGIAVLNIVLGLFVVLNPFGTGKFLLRIIGICLVFSGITDLMNLLYINRKLSNYIKDMKALEQEPKD